jgi:hypothetical protein
MRSPDVLPAIRSAPAARELTADEIRRLRALRYEHYLQSEWWRWRRNLALREAGYQCARCGVNRTLQVHHRSYDRLGAELASDLEVLCRGCHVGEHFNETQTYVGLYARVVSGVIAEGRWTELTEVVEEAKSRCAQYGLPYRHVEFQAAVSQLLPRVPFTPPPAKAELFDASKPGQPLTHAEACGVLARLAAARLIHHMPRARVLTVRDLERRRALQIVAQAIRDQVATCEAVEREGTA